MEVGLLLLGVAPMAMFLAYFAWRVNREGKRTAELLRTIQSNPAEVAAVRLIDNDPICVEVRLVNGPFVRLSGIHGVDAVRKYNELKRAAPQAEFTRKRPLPLETRSQTLPVIPGGEMKKSRFTDSQIIAVLKEGDAGVPVAQLVRKHGISTATYSTWRSKYEGIGVSDLKRMRELEAENSTLKRIYADLALENSAIKDVLSRKP